MYGDDDPIDAGLDPEGPSEDDLARFGDEFVTCPACGSSVYDQAEMCQACGHALARRTDGVPTWAIVVGVVLAVGLVFVLVL